MATDYDGIDDIATVPNSSDWDFGTGNFAIDFVIFPRTTSVFEGVIGTNLNPGANGWTVYFRGSPATQIALTTTEAFSNLVTSGTTRVTLNAWNHVLIQRVGIGATDLQIYINGVAGSAPDDGNVAINSAGSGLVFGRFHVNNVLFPYDGIISEIHILKGSFYSANERFTLFNSFMKRLPLQKSGLVAYWPMDDGPNGTSADGATIHDLSVNSHDATGDDGANNTGLLWRAEEQFSYPSDVIPVISPAIAGNIGSLFNAGLMVRERLFQ